MKHVWIIFSVLSIFSTACQTQEVQDVSIVDRSALIEGAEEAFKAYADLMQTNNFAEALAYYADDPRFVWVENGDIKYESRAQIERAFEEISAYGAVETSFSQPKTWALNNRQVMVFSKYSTTVAKGTDQEFTFGGATTVVMEQTDAGWKFLSGHTSSTPAGRES